MKIAVFLGGASEEREVSIASAVQVVKALRQAGHTVIPVDTAYGVLTPKEEARLLTKGVSQTPPNQKKLSIIRYDPFALTGAPEIADIDVIFLALHGGMGEDGTIQAFLDLAEIAYTGSGHLASGNAMDKDISKRLFRAAKIPTPDWFMAPVNPAGAEEKLGYPLVVKPNRQGSTIGLTVVSKPQDLNPAVSEAFRFDREVIIEKFIPGRELTVGILEDKALTVGEIIPKHGDVFDYKSKYQPGGAKEIFPAKITEKETNMIKELALKAHQALKLEGYSRVDFRMDPQGTCWCLEANTLPGMTSTSLLPQSAQAAGISFSQLCDKICRLAVERHRNKKQPSISKK